MNKNYPIAVLITGGTRGIGAAIADACQQRGALVMVTSRQQSEFPLKLTSKAINILPLDVRDETSVRTLFSYINESLGRLDVLVNNAGIGIFKPLAETSAQEFKQVITTNLFGSFLCAKAAMAAMASSGGRIINIGSIVDRHPAPSNGAYASSKWALRGLSASITAEGFEQKITATHVSLGAVYSEIWGNRPGFDASQMLSSELVGTQLANIVFAPKEARIDSFELYPKQGLLS